ncbi:MAG: hypothetical protein E7542_01750 [Ruminococcaceae bacterium]|nr:hypothetical protein [Oscillospiraceae bacterium]
MDSTIWVAIISFIGTLLGTAGGIVASSKLVNYRLEQLERKVESLGTTTAKIPVMEEKIKNINRRIAKVEHIEVNDFCNVN